MKNFIQKALKKISTIIRPEAKAESGPQRKSRKENKFAPESRASSARKISDQESAPRRRRSSRRKGKRRPRGDTVPAPSGVIPEEKWSLSQFKVPEVEGKTRFHDFDLPEPLMHGISDLGFKYCTPIQADILPSTLSGKDAGGRAQTGTGKTAAFLITIITRMLNNPIQGKRKPGIPRVLILVPTRELVLQVAEEARQLVKYCDLKVVSVFGGMDYQKQRRQLVDAPVDIVVATPGRLLDFRERREIFLNKVEVLIIDEADRMLDMGFIPDVRKIIYGTPEKDKRQTLLFSATLTERINRLAAQWTLNPVFVEIDPEQVAVETVDQIVYIVTEDEKFALLFNIIGKQDLHRVLVFCNRKDEVTRLGDMLSRHGIDCSVISGDIPQKQRTSRLDDFKAGKIRVLVATDVAGRGIHIEGMDHVINFSLPRDAENYVHRIGRTGRVGARGTSYSFADEADSFYIPAIEEFMGRKLNCVYPEDEWLAMPKSISKKPKHRARRSKMTASADQRSRTTTPRPGRRRPPGK